MRSQLPGGGTPVCVPEHGKGRAFPRSSKRGVLLQAACVCRRCPPVALSWVLPSIPAESPSAWLHDAFCWCLFSCLPARIDMIVGPPPPSTPRHKKYPTKGPTALPRESPQYSPRSGCPPLPALSLWNDQLPSLQAT